MNIYDAFDDSSSHGSSDYSRNWTADENRRVRQDDAKDQWLEDYRRNNPQQEQPPRLPRCFGCRAEVETKPRVVKDWRLGITADYEPGSDRLHWCIQLHRSRIRR